MIMRAMGIIGIWLCLLHSKALILVRHALAMGIQLITMEGGGGTVSLQDHTSGDCPDDSKALVLYSFLSHE